MSPSPRKTVSGPHWRLWLYLLVIPWLIVCAKDTRNGLNYYLGLVLLFGLVGRWLSRRNPAWLRSTAVRALDMVGFSLILVILLAEVGLRLFMASGEAPAWLDSSPDPVRYRLDPSAQWLGTLPNSMGFYDHEFTPERTPGVLRIAVLGDSYTVGEVRFEENYVTRTEEALGDSVELMNLGVVHTSVREYTEILRTVGLDFRPSMVLVGIYIGNDIREDTGTGLLSSNGCKVLQALKVTATIASTGSAYLQALSLDGMFETNAQGEEVEAPLMSVEHHLSREYRHLERIFRPPTARRDIAAWEDTEEAIRELVALCRHLDLPLLATLAPDEIQVDPSLMKRVTEEYQADPESFDLAYPNHRLQQLLDELGVPTLDFTEALRQAEKGGRTYHLRGVHWNARGNAAAAEALTPWLAERIEELGLG